MTTLREAAQQALEALEHHGGNLPWNAFVEVRKDLRAALAQQDEPAQEPGAWMQEQVIEDAIEAAYWHFDARKKGLNEWASAPQSEHDAFKAEARKLVRGYFPTRQAQDTKREMLAVAGAFIRGKRAALAQQEEPVAWMFTDREGTEFFEQREDWDGWWTPLYPAPPQRKLVPLTEEEIFAIENDIPDDVVSDRHWTIWYARAVERAHGIGEQP